MSCHSPHHGVQGEVENTVTDGTRFNTEAQKLGVRGVTIVVASGINFQHDV